MTAAAALGPHVPRAFEQSEAVQLLDHRELSLLCGVMTHRQVSAGEELATGHGSSKKRAEQNAARLALGKVQRQDS